MNAALVGRPDLMAGRTSLTVQERMTGISENVFSNTKNPRTRSRPRWGFPKAAPRAWSLPRPGEVGGWRLYLEEGKPTYTYNFLGLQRFTIAAKEPVPAGKATIRYELAYDGGGLGKGGVGTIFVNDWKVAEGWIEHTQSMVFSADEGADVGEDGETPVVENHGIPVPCKFTGKIGKVTIDVKKMKQAEKAEENKLCAEAAHKKAMSDRGARNGRA